MARLPRIVLPGQALHIIQRGHNRQAVFFRDGDYRCYLEWLRETGARYGCDVHAYVLMTNHVHLLATPRTADAPSRWMQAILYQSSLPAQRNPVGRAIQVGTD